VVARADTIIAAIVEQDQDLDEPYRL